MLEKMSIPGVQIPTLYVATCREDVKLAMEHGLPFVRWQAGADALLRQMLRPALEKMFPHIRWDRVLGEPEEFETVIVEVPGGECDVDKTENLSEAGEHIETADVADDRRWFSGKINDHGVEMGADTLEKYMGDLSSHVNLDVLQKLNMLPTFLGDIVDCIKVNLANNVTWTEGYNKKLGQAVGVFSGGRQLPNLIILDISGSIPRGISATMLTLIDTMREQVQADLIITAASSRFYPYGSELPSPRELRSQFGYANESYDFFEILDKQVRGKEWGHVISFGDDDTPQYDISEFKATVGGSLTNGGSKSMGDTIVHHVHHYHTGLYWKPNDKPPYTGYALWCTKCTATMPEVTVDTSWCDVIKN